MSQPPGLSNLPCPRWWPKSPVTANEIVAASRSTATHETAIRAMSVQFRFSGGLFSDAPSSGFSSGFVSPVTAESIRDLLFPIIVATALSVLKSRVQI
jgi:hypothetical protein